MSCNKKKPCNDCPFRKNSLAGWLGPHDVDYFSEVLRADFPYPCHLSLNKPEEHICVGLVHTRNNMCKKARSGVLVEEEQRLYDIENNCFSSIKEFVEHHTKFDKKEK
jgi:hypothetical protein